MRLTVVLDEKGELVGAMQGHATRPDPSEGPGREGFRAGLMAGPGQRLREIEAPDELSDIEDPDEFRERLMQHARRKGLLG